jgi:hypothetical protein
MLVLVLVGVVVAALGLVFESEFVIAVGVTLAALSPLGFLVPWVSGGPEPRAR